MNKGEMTRQRIIAEAASIFNRRGYAGSSMQDVMEATGLEKGGLYRHFATKEELASEAFKYALSWVLEMRMGDIGQVKGAMEKLRTVVRRFVEVPSPVAGGCPLMNTAIDADDGNPALRALAREGILTWKERLCRIVEDGIRDGEIRKGTEPGRVANTIIATLEGALMISRIEGTKSAMLDAQASLERMLAGIEARRSGSARV